VTPLFGERDGALVDGVVARLGELFGAGLVGVYPHGSAVLGSLRPTSDLDLLAVLAGHSTAEQRRALLDHLLDVSGRGARVAPGRPVELTVVSQPDVRPWRYPPPVELQYGEWRRDEYERGEIPGPGVDPDLSLIVTVALRGRGSLAGPSIAEVLDPVPHDDVRRAAVAGVPGLLDELESDTRNVLLTLARIWVTLETGEILTKDGAADWASERVTTEDRRVLADARSDYLGDASPAWDDLLPAATACARRLVAEIDRRSGA
jgi:streptomycin 3"-adenylyltransferase